MQCASAYRLGVLESRSSAEKHHPQKEVIILARREPRKKKVKSLARGKICKVGFLQLLIRNSLRRLSDTFRTIYYI